MKLILAVLTSAVVAMAGSPAEPEHLTIRTRAHAGSQGAVETMTLQVSGGRQRQTRRTDLPDGTPASSITQILRCDQHRFLILNDLAKLYAAGPIRPRGTHEAVAAIRRGGTAVDTRPIAETRTIDAVDTGERRQFGHLTARHVITTTTAERQGGQPAVIAVRDGWYVDVPPRECEDSRDASAVLLATTGGRVDVKWRGTAKSGYPLIERDRIMDAAVTIERRVELLEVSGAPIPSAAFEVPEGYAPALSLPYGGHDLTRADTMVNRVSSWWETASSWVLSFWR